LKSESIFFQSFERKRGCHAPSLPRRNNNLH
jgi:hypothetical protein